MTKKAKDQVVVVDGRYVWVACHHGPKLVDFDYAMIARALGFTDGDACRDFAQCQQAKAAYADWAAQQ